MTIVELLVLGATILFIAKGRQIYNFISDYLYTKKSGGCNACNEQCRQNTIAQIKEAKAQLESFDREKDEINERIDALRKSWTSADIKEIGWVEKNRLYQNYKQEKSVLDEKLRRLSGYRATQPRRNLEKQLKELESNLAKLEG